MNFAIIGIDEDAAALAEGAVEAGHQIVWLDSAGTQASRIAPLAPQARRGEDWQTLLDGSLAEAIIVGSAPEQEQELRQDQLRRLAQAAVPLLVVHPVVDSLLFYLEIDMIAREAGGLLQHYFPGVRHPALETMAGLLNDADAPEGLGTAEQILCERYLSCRDPQPVTRAFARDIDLLEPLAGPFNEITALGGSRGSTDYTNLAVQLAGSARVPVRWSVHSVQGSELGKITLIGQRGSVELSMPADPEAWRLVPRLGEAGEEEEVVFDEHQPARSAIAAFAESLGGGAAGSTWRRATRAMELADSIELSLRKGRTIEVHFQVLSEQTAFRGTMAMFGCGLLLVLPLLVVLAGILGDVFGVPLLEYWYVPVLALMVLFLVFQSVVKLLLATDSSTDADSAQEVPGAEGE